MREWWNDTPARLKSGQDAYTFTDCLNHWGVLELDLHADGIDIESGILHERSWRWLRVHITRIAANPTSRLHKALTKGA
ncbi:hypothetical protein [Rhodococcus sp. SJ-2]